MFGPDREGGEEKSREVGKMLAAIKEGLSPEKHLLTGLGNGLKNRLKTRGTNYYRRAVLTNGKTTAQFLVENQVPILRQKDIMGKNEAITPCRRIYLVIQLMYIDGGNLTTHHHAYWNLVRRSSKPPPALCL